jgi:alkylation response protein AidB-like acyl-CoA dehydrogenase
MDERTNATFYSDVRVPDRYRVGEVDGAVKVMSFALSMEQGGGGFERGMREMAQAVTDWARRTERDGRPVIEDAQTLARLARVQLDASISQALSARVLATRLSGQPDLAYGPAAKVFCTEAFIAASADLLAASRQGGPGTGGDGIPPFHGDDDLRGHQRGDAQHGGREAAGPAAQPGLRV